ncbi:MAG TPA: tRNA-uridine aminocarboxypropyltransferase [Vulgatibacter sp.]|nr:tRNA-uridine aminocarboxypropyltransferase [Vulgatibacter sp.]
MSFDPRPTCLRCRRPISFCWCRLIEPVDTRTRLVFLQHHRESRVRIGTARMAHLALPNSEFHVGVRFSLRPGPRTAVLFPGDDALPPETLREGEPWTLVVVDGTWPQARKIVERDPVLASLPRIGFRPVRPGNYRIRREPSPECLATVEAVAQVLGMVEGSSERFDSMIRAFTHMVDLQIAAANDDGSRARRRRRSGPKPIDRDLLRLREAGSRLVLLHAEANSHPRTAGLPGRPELVHVVAQRPASGEGFEAVLAPRRPLAPSVPHHIGLDRACIEGGAEAGEALAGLRSYLRPDDVIAAWGLYPIRLVEAEGLPLSDPLDLRGLLARRLGRKPGALADNLGAGALPPLPGRGRAGRTVAELHALVRLLERGDRTPPVQAPAAIAGLD